MKESMFKLVIKLKLAEKIIGIVLNLMRNDNSISLVHLRNNNLMIKQGKFFEVKDLYNYNIDELYTSPFHIEYDLIEEYLNLEKSIDNEHFFIRTSKGIMYVIRKNAKYIPELDSTFCDYNESILPMIIE